MIFHQVMSKKIGFSMAFVMYEQVLTEQQKTRFEKGFEEGYDMSDPSITVQHIKAYNSIVYNSTIHKSI